MRQHIRGIRGFREEATTREFLVTAMFGWFRAGSLEVIYYISLYIAANKLGRVHAVKHRLIMISKSRGVEETAVSKVLIGFPAGTGFILRL
jgi:hypothetical protein